jgi:hypothetical protein
MSPARWHGTQAEHISIAVPPSLSRPPAAEQRIERTTRNREAARVRTAKKKQLFEKIDREIEEA